MGADFVIHYSCSPKKALGGGDEVAGTAELLARLKARSHAALIRDHAARTGKDPADCPVTLNLRNATTGEVESRDVTYAELAAQAGALEPWKPDCARCPVNVFADSFGCVGRMNYPIAQETEQWLMDRLQPADTVGGFVLLRAVADLGYTGGPMRQWREADLFQIPVPIERALDPEDPGATRVTSDQVWQAVFRVGSELQPFHCLMLLTWFGCVTLHGDVVTTPEQWDALCNLETPREKAQATEAALGEPADHREVLDAQRLLYACYLCWVFDVPLLMDS